MKKKKKQQRIESNALFFSLVIFVSFEIVCASSSDTSQIIAAFRFMIDFTFWHLCNNTIEPMHVSRHNRYIIQYPMQSVNGRWLIRKINFDFHWKMWIPRIVFIFSIKLSMIYTKDFGYEQKKAMKRFSRFHSKYS